MSIEIPKFQKVSQYSLNFISFTILFILCYFLYMQDAIEKFKLGASIVTKRSELLPYEAPSIIICPEPGFKQSIFKKYNLTTPAQFVFHDEKSLRVYFGN